MEEKNKFFAFISYSSVDAEWGFRLQKKLENYRMPSTLCTERGWERKPIRPVFFALTDIQPSELDEELKMRLRSSKHLIVICSPNSAQSVWVGKEIEYFYSLGRRKNIHLFIVDGIPNSGSPLTECFNPKLRELGIPELLGANIHEKYSFWPFVNRERAYVQLITKLLDVEFDSIWQRHKRHLVQDVIFAVSLSIAFLLSILFVWKKANLPFDASIRLREVTKPNGNLPPLKDAIVALKLDDNVRIDTIQTLDGNALIQHVPYKYKGIPVRLSVSCEGYLPVEKEINLDKENVIEISRDEKYYGEIRAKLYSKSRECLLPNTEITIEGFRCFSNDSGIVQQLIPLECQSRVYIMTSNTLRFENDTLYAPHGENDYIFVE